jgi:glucuronate isomerase
MRYLIVITLLDDDGVLNAWVETENAARVLCNLLWELVEVEQIELHDAKTMTSNKIAEWPKK